MKEILNKALQSSWMIVKLVVPFAVGIDILNYLGVIDNVSFLFEPITEILGLPAGVALALAAGFFFNLYAGIAVAASLGLNGFEWTIVGTFLAICHSIPLEVAVLKKVGFPVIPHSVIRLIAGLLGGILAANIISPDLIQITNEVLLNQKNETFWTMIINSIKNSVYLTAKIILLVTVLIFLFELLRNWRPVEKYLDKHTYLSSLLVGGLLGVTYGAGILLKDIKSVEAKHKMYLLTFLMLAHGLIEETLLFGLFHADLLAIFGIRLGIAIIGVLLVYLFSILQISKKVNPSSKFSH